MSAVEMDARPMLATDRNFVLSSWLRSYAAKSRDARDYGELHREFFDDYSGVVQALLARSNVIVWNLRGHEDVVVAWAAFEGEVLHYFLTKPRWRRLGVAKQALADFVSMPVVYTHMTSDAMRCPVPAGWAYRRYKIWPGEVAA